MEESKIWSFGKGLTLYLTTEMLTCFADENINVAYRIEVIFDRIENIVGKKRKCWLQHFLSFQLCFQNPPFSGLWKVWIVW